MTLGEMEKYVSTDIADYITDYKVDYENESKHQSMVWIKDEWIAIKDITIYDNGMDVFDFTFLSAINEPERYKKGLIDLLKFTSGGLK